MKGFAIQSLIVALGVYGIGICHPAWAQECADLTAENQPQVISSEYPSLPVGATIVEKGRGYLIYLKEAKLRIIFDSRIAEVGLVDTSLHNSSGAKAILDPTMHIPIILEGRHRAVSASQGFMIRKALGGTDKKYWLDYHCEEDTRLIMPQVPPRSRLVDVPITWDTDLFK